MYAAYDLKAWLQASQDGSPQLAVGSWEALGGRCFAGVVGHGERSGRRVMVALRG